MGDMPLVLLILYTVFIGFMTLTPYQLDVSPEGPIGRLLQFFADHQVTSWLTYTLVEKLANVAMFVPFGFLLALHMGRRRWWVGWAAGAAFTCLIEGAQVTLLSPTRFGTISDLITNTLGAGIGAVLALLIMVLLPERDEPEEVERVVR
ncbi:VanZ family protein [Brevibacterium aurantiacum]|uniref:Glycopeptide antibiotics resistance protein n=2 Tax=Brevibacteriaceae TaxID=85019 RepID=A0A2H1HTB7_BREAU|nr:VanZ family protein [Brevibacterium aurantiacum]AZT91771.1 VanZ family protein [Brevibacterium aurantiacum]PCC51067.1 VanZ family protein [Brevibacterium aurantiacum]PCC56313.1 VanZ family protein [Brevibacterium aurantiacum]RCS86975.1 VanZ family protein [Brevibacterium aurantiacum]